MAKDKIKQSTIMIYNFKQEGTWIRIMIYDYSQIIFWFSYDHLITLYFFPKDSVNQESQNRWIGSIYIYLNVNLTLEYNDQIVYVESTYTIALVGNPLSSSISCNKHHIFLGIQLSQYLSPYLNCCCYYHQEALYKNCNVKFSADIVI